jgi:hypothetical protein
VPPGGHRLLDHVTLTGATGQLKVTTEGHGAKCSCNVPYTPLKAARKHARPWCQRVIIDSYHAAACMYYHADYKYTAEGLSNRNVFCDGSVEKGGFPGPSDSLSPEPVGCRRAFTIVLPTELLDSENAGVAFGISLISCIEAEQ